MSNPFPGQLPARGDARESTGGENAQLSVGEASYRAAGSPEIPPDPRPQRMSSGDHFNPQQFADQLDTAYVQRSAPLVHGPNKTGYYGEDDDRFGGQTNAR